MAGRGRRPQLAGRGRGRKPGRGNGRGVATATQASAPAAPLRYRAYSGAWGWCGSGCLRSVDTRYPRAAMSITGAPSLRTAPRKARAGPGHRRRRLKKSWSLQVHDLQFATGPWCLIEAVSRSTRTGVVRAVDGEFVVLGSITHTYATILRVSGPVAGT